MRLNVKRKARVTGNGCVARVSQESQESQKLMEIGGRKDLEIGYWSLEIGPAFSTVQKGTC